MERLRDHADDLDALVAQTAAAQGLPEAYVEKDFWVTEVLRAAAVDRTVSMPDGSSAPVTFLFKGGTSLSRVFGIVDRFSEDVDLLAVFPEGAAANARHKVLKQVDTDVTVHLRLTKSDVTVGASTTGVKRYTTYHYPTARPGDGLKEGVLLELGSRGGTYPAGLHPYRSMVADYAITELGETADTWEEFAPFEANVLAPERTLLEKIAAVHDASVRNDTFTLLSTAGTSTTSTGSSARPQWPRRSTPSAWTGSPSSSRTSTPTALTPSSPGARAPSVGTPTAWPSIHRLMRMLRSAPASRLPKPSSTAHGSRSTTSSARFRPTARGCDGVFSERTQSVPSDPHSDVCAGRLSPTTRRSGDAGTGPRGTPQTRLVVRFRRHPREDPHAFPGTALSRRHDRPRPRRPHRRPASPGRSCEQSASTA